MMRFKFGNDRRQDWRCFFCCHVRTGTIFLGVWQLLLHIMALSVIATILRNSDLIPDYTDDSFLAEDNNASNQNKMNLAPALPTPLSSEFGEHVQAEVRRLEVDVNWEGERERIVFGRVETVTEPLLIPEVPSSEEASHSSSDEASSEKRPPSKKHSSFSAGSLIRDILGTRSINSHDLNAGIVVTFCTFIITLLMVYGAVRNKPSYLMPFFCLQVFDFCIACLTAVGYLCYLPDFRRLVVESRQLPVPLQDLNPQCLSFLLLLTFTFAMALKAYFIGVVWRCYKYLALRRVAQLRTVHFIDSPPETMGAAVATDSPLTHQEALLLLPDYETAINDPRYAVPLKGGEEKAKGAQTSLGFDSLVLMAPPPAYSSVVHEVNQVVPDEVVTETASGSQERAVPASPEASPSREPLSPPASAAARSNNSGSNDAPST